MLIRRRNGRSIALYEHLKLSTFPLSIFNEAQNTYKIEEPHSGWCAAVASTCWYAQARTNPQHRPARALSTPIIRIHRIYTSLYIRKHLKKGPKYYTLTRLLRPKK